MLIKKIKINNIKIKEKEKQKMYNIYLIYLKKSRQK